MRRSLNRRDFISAAVASAGAAVLTSCGEPRSKAPLVGETGADQGQPPGEPALAESLSREDFLELLDAMADSNMRRCHHCAQASFLSLREGFDLEGGAILKALTPLPGIAERGETCGAVIGSLMALGLVFGRDRIDDWAGWRASLGPARDFCARFEQELGSTMCGDIQERHFGKRYDLTDPADLAEFQSANPTEICGGVVRKAVRIAAEIVLDKRGSG